MAAAMVLMSTAVVAGSSRWEGGKETMLIRSGQNMLDIGCNPSMGTTLFITLVVPGQTALPTVDDGPAPFVLVVEGGSGAGSRLNAEKGYYFAPDETRLAQVPLDRGFLDAFAAGDALAVMTPDGKPVTRFTLAGSGAAKERFMTSCGF